MSLRYKIKQLINIVLRRFGHEIAESNLLYDWQKAGYAPPRRTDTPLPDGAQAYLRPDNPRLKDLQQRYARFNSTVTTPSVWTDDLVKSDDIQYFRGDNAYVWQLRGQNMSEINYVLTKYYVNSIDKLGLLDKLTEDNYFGAFDFSIDSKTVSRDLLDSIIEINFLEKHLNLSARNNLCVMDIGAGYGRLAHRMTSALPNISTYLCTDAVAYSTFISEYYLRFRKLGEKTKVVPLDEIETTLEHQPVDIAINIHSFSECTMAAINWWLSLLTKHQVRYFMIVPNAGLHGGQSLLTNEGHDIQKVVEAQGYRLIAKEPKYRDPAVQQFGLNPTYFYLFEMSAA